MMWIREVHNSVHRVLMQADRSLQVAHVSVNTFPCYSGIIVGLVGEM